MENIKQIVDALRNYRIGYISFTYRNKEGEVSKRLVNIGFSYERLKEKDLAVLNEGIAYEPNEKFTLNDHLQAIQELKKSFTNPSETRSEGQQNAYLTLMNDEGKPSAVRYCYETKCLYVKGLTEKKTIIQEGVYKTVNSKPVTLAKKAIQKKHLKCSKWGNFNLGSMLGNIKINKVEYETGNEAYELEILD